MQQKGYEIKGKSAFRSVWCLRDIVFICLLFILFRRVFFCDHQNDAIILSACSKREVHDSEILEHLFQRSVLRFRRMDDLFVGSFLLIVALLYMR